MKNLLLPVMLALLAFSGCATINREPEAPDIIYNVNEHNRSQMWLLRYNRMWDDEAGLSPSRFAFDLEMFVRGGATGFMIMIDYYSDEKFFIDSGESLILTIGGEQMKFNTGGAIDNTQLVDNCVIKETAFFDLSKDKLRSIAHAQNKVKVEVKGHIGYITAWLGEDNIANIKKFYDECVDVTSTAK
jgi:hypothetical protein